MLIDDAPFLVKLQQRGTGERDRLGVFGENRPPFDHRTAFASDRPSPPQIELVSFLRERSARVVPGILRIAEGMRPEDDGERPRRMRA